MKLFYVANIRIPTEKAHGIQIVKMCEAFSRLHIDTTLIVPNRRNPIAENPHTYYGLDRSFTIKKLFCIDAVSWGKIGFLVESVTFAFSLIVHVLLKKHIQFFTRDEIIAAVLTFIGKSVVWEGHHGQNNRFTRFLIQKRVPIVVISEGLKKFYVSHGAIEERITVFHDAVDLSEFAEIPILEAREKIAVTKDAFIVGYIGKFKTMGKSKGVEDLIHAFSQFHQKVPSAHLLLVGINESEKKEVKECFESYQVARGGYTVVGHVPHKNIVWYECASDVLVMNYPNKEHYVDFMSPLKLFEYMASGRAIIASDLPSIREVIDEHCARIIEPDSVPALTIALLDLYESPESRVKLSTEAKHRVHAYTWEERAKVIGDFMNTSYVSK